MNTRVGLDMMIGVGISSDGSRNLYRAMLILLVGKYHNNQMQ